MPNQVGIVHGWSDTSRSFESLREFLRTRGYEAVPIWLGDYISMDDDVRIEDVAKRMEEVIREKMAKEGLKSPFDLVVHSTGGLVARQWLSAYYAEGNAPVKRLVMLAPANFGSRLAAMGQSLLGRVVKGWKNWFHTGKEMLRALELASPLQWDLAQGDLFVPEGQAGAQTPYGGDRVWPFVISGTHPYPGTLRQIVNENGSDGTVRVAAANLNARGITIDFSQNEKEPALTPWTQRHGDVTFPFAVLADRTHSSIITPDKSDVETVPDGRPVLGDLLLEALRCESLQEYSSLAERWWSISEDTAGLALDDSARRHLFRGDLPSKEYFHQYLQVIVRVVDDHGADVSDYFLEFFGPDTKKDDEAIYFHREVLEHVHANSQGPATRCLFLDRSDLLGEFYKRIPQGRKKEVGMSISATPPGNNVSYFQESKMGAAGHVVVHREAEEGRFLKRNCTHLVKIVIPRTPHENVFKFARR